MEKPARCTAMNTFHAGGKAWSCREELSMLGEEYGKAGRRRWRLGRMEEKWGDESRMNGREGKETEGEYM